MKKTEEKKRKKPIIQRKLKRGKGRKREGYRGEKRKEKGQLARKKQRGKIRTRGKQRKNPRVIKSVDGEGEREAIGKVKKRERPPRHDLAAREHLE